MLQLLISFIITLNKTMKDLATFCHSVRYLTSKIKFLAKKRNKIEENLGKNFK